MRAVYFAVLLLAGCKTLHTLDVKEHQEAASAATTETHEVKSAGPEHIVMTVEEYEQLCPAAEVGGADGTQSRPLSSAVASGAPATGQSAPAVARIVAPDASRVNGALIRRTVTVTDRGPSLDDLRQLSKVQTDLNTALAVHEVKKDGPAGLLGLLGSLWPVVLIGGAILAGFVVWKLKPGWLSVIFKLLGRTP